MRVIRNSIATTLAVALLVMAPVLAHAQAQSPTRPPTGGGRGSGMSIDRLRQSLNAANDGSAQGGDAEGASTLGGSDGAAAPEGAGSAAPASQGGGGESGAGGGSEVLVYKGDRAVGVQGTEGFEPILNYQVEYPELPETTDTIDYPAMGAAAPMVDFLSVLADTSGWNVVASKGIETMILQFSVKGVTPKQAMEILKFHGVYYTFDEANNALYVMTTEEYLAREYGALKNEKFHVIHADVGDMEQILTALLSPAGKLISDPRTGNILVWDTRANLEEMEDAMERLDVPLESRVFPLRYMLAEDVLESVETVLTERGTAQADPRSNTLIVADLPARQEEVAKLVAALDKELDTRTWILDYLEPETVQERLENIIPEEVGTITSDEDTHQISITAMPERLEQADKLIQAWDIKPKQVQIEAYLVTANTTVTRNFGIDWAYFDNVSGNPIAILNGGSVEDPLAIPEEGQRFSVGRLPYQVPLRIPATNDPVRDINGRVVVDPDFKGDHVAAVIDYLDKQGEITVLTKSRVAVRDGMEASFEKTEEVPYQNVAYGTMGYGNDNTNGFNNPYVIPTSVQKEQVGTILKVLPRITEQGTVAMEIEAEDSTAEMITIVSGGRPSTVPQVRRSVAKTEVVIHNGQTIVLGGLRSGTIEDDVERVPVLGDLPFLGRLFKSTERRRENRDLLVFLTPTIISGYTEREAERLAEVDAAVAEKLRNSLKPLMERIENKLSAEPRELYVAVGQVGTLYVDRRLVTLEQVQDRFAAVENPSRITVVIRAHPSAPAGLSEQIAQMASDAGLQVTRDTQALPFVPAPAPGTLPGELLPLSVPVPGADVPPPPPGGGPTPLPPAPGDSPAPDEGPLPDAAP